MTSPALERYRELAIQRITYTHDEHGTAKLSAALHLTQQALAEAAASLAEFPSGGVVGEIRKRHDHRALNLNGWLATFAASSMTGDELRQLAEDMTTLLAALTASEAERERLKAELAGKCRPGVHP